MHLPLVMVAVKPPPLPVAALPCQDHCPSTYMNLPIQYLSPSLIPRVRAAVSPNWKLHRGLLPKHTMSGTCAGCAGGAACCLPVGAGPFGPNGLSWATAPRAEESKAAARKVRRNPNDMRCPPARSDCSACDSTMAWGHPLAPARPTASA